MVGYPVAFLLVPIALATFGGATGHRLTGKTYILGMTFLYLTGTFLTLTRNDWSTWVFARNLTFNFFGYSLLLYGWRAIYLFRQSADAAPQRLDYALAIMLTSTVIGLAAVAVFKNTPMRVLTVIGIVLVVMEWQEIRNRFQPHSMLFRRHVRFILASYFYVLTVVSIVHLSDELPRDVKWLWPSMLGSIVIYLTTANSNPVITRHGAGVVRWTLMATLVVSLVLGSYSLYKVFTGRVGIDSMQKVPSVAKGPMQQ
jgi:hypothetical protein